MPDAEKLARIREEIDQNSGPLKMTLLDPTMRREILGGIPDDEDLAVKAFISQNKESALKIKPKVSAHFFVSIPLLQVASLPCHRNKHPICQLLRNARRTKRFLRGQHARAR